MTKEQLLAEVEDLLRSMPPQGAFAGSSSEQFAWLGRAVAIIERWNPPKSLIAQAAANHLRSGIPVQIRHGYTGLMTLVQQARADLRLDVGPMSTVLEQGATFDYFDEVRKIILTAKTDLFFVDPYLDAEFVSRYLSHSAPGVAVRLLAEKKLSTLLPAIEMFSKQHSISVAVRSTTGLHDRFVFVDRSTCYLSGASFKDGAKNAPTLLSQIIDANVLTTMYESKWTTGTVER